MDGMYLNAGKRRAEAVADEGDVDGADDRDGFIEELVTRTLLKGCM